VGFDRLLKLYLDNNVIVTIEKLDHLVNLEWLDLSYNNIETITGLDALTKLQSLSLFNNRLSSLDGLEPLSECLEVLSVGSNLIKELEETKKLRRFAKLHAVTFAGNEVATRQPHEYRAFVLAHLRHLRFLDYRLIDELEVAQAESDGGLQEKLQEIRQQEAEEEEAREAEYRSAERSKMLADAHMGSLDGFWGKLEAATAEFTQKIAVVEQLVELQARQRPKFEARIEEFVSANLTAVAVKASELREFREAAAAMNEENNAEALAHIAKCARVPCPPPSRARALSRLDPLPSLPFLPSLPTFLFPDTCLPGAGSTRRPSKRRGSSLRRATASPPRPSRRAST